MFENKNSVLFDDIGSKLKVTALILFALGMIAAVICAIVILVTLEEDGFWMALICGVSIGGASWISSIVMYGLGEIVHHLEDISAYTGKMTKNGVTGVNTDSKHVTATSGAKGINSGNGMIMCSKCGKYQFADRDTCNQCGAKLR